MTTGLARKSLVVGAGIAGLAILVTTATALYLGLNAKARVESAASEALGMEVRVAGRSSAGILPGLHVELQDVHARVHGADVASVKEVDLGIDFLPLLRKEVRIGRIALKGLRIAIERGRDGKLNVASSPETPVVLPTLSITNMSASDATLIYSDQQSGKRLEALDCKLELDHLEYPAGDNPALRRSLTFGARLVCGRLRTINFTASDLKLSAVGKGDAVVLDPITMRLLGGVGSGSVHADYSGQVAVYKVHGDLSQFRMEEFFKALSPKQVGTGLMDFSTDLILSGSLTDSLVRTVNGHASLRGQDLRLEIGDLDKKFSNYESSQNFNLVDVAAVFFAGPLGLAVTKGYNFATIFEGTGESTPISTLVSEWQIRHGVAHARDVAMATPQNRIAMKGNLDFVTGQFDDVTVALVDARGCPMVQQRVRGPFLEPQVEQPNVLRELTGPTRRLAARIGRLFSDKKCDVFYAGSVASPARP